MVSKIKAHIPSFGPHTCTLADRVALEKLSGSGKVCQGFKLCSILKVSEGYLRLCNLAAVDRASVRDYTYT